MERSEAYIRFPGHGEVFIAIVADDDGDAGELEVDFMVDRESGYGADEVP